MKKKITSLFMAVVILISVVSVGTLNVAAASSFNTSNACIEIIKAEEGFVKYPMWDYAQYSVGYGTKCPDDKLEEYSKNGITEAEAEALLRKFLDAFEEDINEDLIDKFGLKLSQNQFDALVMFSYNCGTGWIYNDSDNLRKAVINGATGNELIDRFARWCNAGGQIKTFLLRRRLCEANMYLNNVYSRTVPDNFGYVLYDANGGVASPNVQGYDANLTSAIIPVPTYSGYEFVGWYTAKVGGNQVTVLDASVRNSRLYARWKDANGNDPNADDGKEGVWITVAYDDVNLREGPGTTYKVIGTANKGEQFKITETKTGGGYTWGKYAGGWICLDLTNYDEVKNQTGTTPPQTKPEDTVQPEKPVEPVNVTGTVKVSDCLCVRSGPGTGYAVTGYLYNGNKVVITEQKIVGHMTWGKIATGWISMSYVVLDKTETAPETKPEETTPPATEPETKPEGTTPPATKPETKPEETTPPATKPESKPEQKPVTPTIWTGTIKVSDCLRVRSGAGTSYAIVGYLYPNDKVTITEKKKVGSTEWGKTAKGWISMDYVVINTTSGGSDNNGGATSKPVSGTVKVNDYLRIRSGPGTTYSVAGYLSPKARVEILEQKTVGGVVWGRISKGWISMDYVVLDAQSSGSQGQTSVTTKTVTADCLRIRSDAGTSNTIVGYLYRGAKVQILSTKKVGNTQWGKTSKGWISMDYVK